MCKFRSLDIGRRKNNKLSLTSLFVLWLLCAAGCASLPRVDPLLKDASVQKQPKLVGARGPLSAKESKAILDKLKREAPDADMLQRHLALEEAITGTPLVVGNKVNLLIDGTSTYNALFAAIQGAKRNINLETYIFDDDEIGNKLADMLIEKQKRGVQVNLIYDSVGSSDTPKAFFQRLKDNGIQVVEFNPINPLNAKKGWEINNRDHRKLLVVDGTIAFTGGYNISAVYSKKPSGSAPSKPKYPPGPWRDTQIQIEGPVVAEFQKLFIQNWIAQGGPALNEAEYLPPLKKKGDEVVRAIGSGPDGEPSLNFITFISAITNAEKSIHITNAYFAPDEQLLNALKGAAQRGVDVTLILPSYTDFWAIFHAGRSHYTELLQAGVKIYERKKALLHAKTAVIDEVWSTVGSTNLDWRSFLHNYEINAVVLGRSFGKEMEATFKKDLEESTRIELEAWQQRPFSVRMKEWAARLWEYWL